MTERRDAHEPLEPGVELVGESIMQLLASLPTATLSAQLRRAGATNGVIGGLDVLRPDMRMPGRARTLRYLPFRDDLAAAKGMSVQRAMPETLQNGDVIVIDARGVMASGVIGDISVQRAKMLGITGILTDGPIRDTAVISAFDVPVYFSGHHPASPAQAHVPFEADVPVACAGVTIMPGDLLVGDADGVVVLPPALAAKVAQATADQEREERFVAERVAEGEPLDGLFPMGAAWRVRYEESLPQQLPPA